MESCSQWYVDILMPLCAWAFRYESNQCVWKTTSSVVCACTQDGCHGYTSGGVRDECSWFPPAHDFLIVWDITKKIQNKYRKEGKKNRKERKKEWGRKKERQNSVNKAWHNCIFSIVWCAPPGGCLQKYILIQSLQQRFYSASFSSHIIKAIINTRLKNELRALPVAETKDMFHQCVLISSACVSD